MPDTDHPPALTFVARISVQVGPPITVGQTPGGLRRVVPILGGRVSGPRLTGTVVAAGADYQLLGEDGVSTLDARYVLQADDGAFIYVVNRGLRRGPPDVMAQLARGEPVDASAVYFQSTPRFETEASAHRWLTRSIFVASGVREPDRVILSVFEVG